MRTQLLCTFTNKKSLEKTLDIITDTYSILYDKIFIYDEDNKLNNILTYNISHLLKDSSLDNTISIHRKKETNTFYTINALNALIASLNNGICDRQFKINWNDYENQILLVRNDELTRVKIIFKCIYFLPS